MFPIFPSSIRVIGDLLVRTEILLYQFANEDKKKKKRREYPGGATAANPRGLFPMGSRLDNLSARDTIPCDDAGLSRRQVNERASSRKQSETRRCISFHPIPSEKGQIEASPLVAKRLRK